MAVKYFFADGFVVLVVALRLGSGLKSTHCGAVTNQEMMF